MLHCIGLGFNIDRRKCTERLRAKLTGSSATNHCLVPHSVLFGV
ncbi:hypothetical protein F383_14398 [Gossypium arboreum]|uniref:Uncharacterized protein n=1 Tax=Gossypium arboreum TaxID=29729 RepID=A0A0B0NDD4_GOSAR|nr:hypothetical protein F383_14398 [Gossypium arboreum]